MTSRTDLAERAALQARSSRAARARVASAAQRRTELLLPALMGGVYLLAMSLSVIAMALNVAATV